MRIEHVASLDAREVARLKTIAAQIFAVLPDGEIDGVLENRTSFCLHFAAADDRVVGFKIGYRLDRDRFYSWLGGVIPDHRKRGVASALMVAQHDVCRDAGFKVIETRTKNKFRDMIVLNLRHGFDIVGAFTDEKREAKLILEKTLDPTYRQ